MPFLTDGRCVLIDEPGNPALPSGEVLDDEHYLLDTVLRVPLQTAGFRYQRFHPFGLDRDHLYAWIEGAPYTGSRPHRTVALVICSQSGRLLVSDYAADPAAGHPHAAETLRASFGEPVRNFTGRGSKPSARACGLPGRVFLLTPDRIGECH